MDNELIYVDTNVYMDYFEGRTDRLRPLGEFAFNLFRKSLNCEYRIIISPVVVEELRRNGFEGQFSALLEELNDSEKITNVDISQEDRFQASLRGN